MGPSKSPQQEMVQAPPSESEPRREPLRRENLSVNRRTVSPFWRNRTANGRSNSLKSSDSNIVIGASYSHADILKFDSLYASLAHFDRSMLNKTRSLTPSSSRPHTPPSLSKTNTRNVKSPPPAANAALSSPPKKSNHSQLLSSTTSDWEDDVDDEEEEETNVSGYTYDDGMEEDEFGLPSISSMKREARKRPPVKQFNDPGGGIGSSMNGALYSLDPPRLSSRARANSSDIALERGPLNYPAAKKADRKILRPQYKDILKDPANSLHLISHPPISANASPKETEAQTTRISRINKFKRILQATNISLSDLRDCAWSGIPAEVRAMSWQVLLGYLPTSSERRMATLDRKRKAYLDGVNQAFSRNSNTTSSASSRSPSTLDDKPRSRGLDEALWHQISIDVPRTSPHLQLYSYEATQRSLERILYVWAIRHPASGYVQGINDLLTPFWQVFLGAYVTDFDVSSGMDPGQLPRPVLDAVEADAFWCLTKLLDGIQDNYIFAQPGIVRQVSALKDLTTRIDGTLAKHLESEGVEFMQFSFRWMNCLLMREVSVNCIIRMWDTYMSEEQGFSEFHLYVCAAFLVKWSEQLTKMEFQEIMMFLQSLPTKDWTEKDVELLLSEAYIWQSLFRGSSAHLRNSGSNA